MRKALSNKVGWFVVVSVLVAGGLLAVSKDADANSFTVGKHTVQTVDPRLTVNLTVLAVSPTHAGYVHAKWTYTRDDYPIESCPVDYHGVLPDFTAEEFRKFSMKACNPFGGDGQDADVADSNADSGGCE